MLGQVQTSSTRLTRESRHTQTVSRMFWTHRGPSLIRWDVLVYNRRRSVPFDSYTPQYAFGYNEGSQTLRGLPLMPGSQYQPHIQPTMPGLVPRRPTPSLMTLQTTGGPLSGPYSASPPRTPQHTRSSPHHHPQLDLDSTFVSPRLRIE